MISLPLRVDEIDADWLTQALRERYPGVAVLSAERGETLQGTATKIRLHLTYDAAGTRANLPSRLIAKGGFSAHRELMYSIYEIEARFYCDIAPHLNLRTPQCFYAGWDGARKQGVVLLEDLDARGARCCRVQEPLTYPQAAALLAMQVEYHARWWNDSRTFAPGGDFDWVKPLDPLPEGEAGAYQRGQLRPEVYAACMSLPRGVAVSRAFHDRDRMERALEQLRAIDRRSPFCLLHADCHLGNLYFDAEGRPGLLDWQSVRTGPCMHDFTYFLVSSLDMLDRRKWERALLSHYLEALQATGIAAPTFDEAWEAYRAQILYGLYYWLVNPIEFQAELNNCAVAPRFAHAALDHGTFELLLGTP